jgi:hypothetical protein
VLGQADPAPVAGVTLVGKVGLASAGPVPTLGRSGNEDGAVAVTEAGCVCPGDVFG